MAEYSATFTLQKVTADVDTTSTVEEPTLSTIVAKVENLTLAQDSKIRFFTSYKVGESEAKELKWEFINNTGGSINFTDGYSFTISTDLDKILSTGEVKFTTGRAYLAADWNF